jgi:RNA polymerase sigma-70 factor (ECF subfamily)
MTGPEAPSAASTDPQTWVDRYGDALYRIALVRVRSADVAEEVVQETFLAAFRARAGFRGGSAELTWLVGIMKNKIVDHFRARRRTVPATDLESGAGAFDGLFDDRGRWLRPPAKWREDPDALLRQREFVQVLRECLSGVPDRQAQAFLLRILDDRATEEVCKTLGVSATNLGVLIHRARHRLRTCLEDRWFEGKGE